MIRACNQLRTNRRHWEKRMVLSIQENDFDSQQKVRMKEMSAFCSLIFVLVCDFRRVAIAG
jgi:hypothetical protein